MKSTWHIFTLIFFLICYMPFVKATEENVSASEDSSNIEDRTTLSLLDSQEKTLYIDLHLENHIFYPSEIIVPSGKKIRITLYNKDKTIEEFESFDLKREKIVLGNNKVIIVLAPLKAGEYKFFGEFNEETAQGKIIVQDVDN